MAARSKEQTEKGKSENEKSRLSYLFSFFSFLLKKRRTNMKVNAHLKTIDGKTLKEIVQKLDELEKLIEP